MPRPLMSEIVALHAEEAAFLFPMRAAAAVAPHHDRRSLAELDERIDAHLDGLRVAGDAGLAVAASAIDAAEPGTASVAAALAAERGDANVMDAAVAAGVASIDVARAVVAGLAWAPFAAARPVLDALLAAGAPAQVRRIGLAAAAAHRHDPGDALRSALVDDDAALRARALRAVGELGLGDLQRALRGQADADDAACRYWASWSLALLGDGAAPRALWSIADGGGAFAERAARASARRLEVRDARARIEALGATEGGARAAIAAAGALGEPALVPWLVDRMKTPALARVAAEAFSTITGAVIERELEAQAPEGFVAGPTEEASDDGVAPDRDGPLHWPAPAAVEAWWKAREGGYRRGTRYLGGAPMTGEALEREVVAASQQRRAEAALELAMRRGRGPLPEVRARAT